VGMREPAIVASVLGADYSRLGAELADLTAAGVDRIQWDVMDGHFVPNLTFGADLVGACRSHTDLPFEAHLMIDEPDRWLDDYVGAGCDTVIVHVEACRHLHRALSAIRGLGAKAGAALNPATPLEVIRHVLDQIDLLLIMTVNPGFGGQAYIGAMEPKITEARRMIDGGGLDVSIEVDGGISPRTAPGARQAGAELLVAGSSILGHPEGKRAGVAGLRRSLGLSGSDPAATGRKRSQPG
jgi:ribulose-phosphate 3-epimerase